MIYGLVGYAGAGKSTIAYGAIRYDAEFQVINFSKPIVKMLEVLGVNVDILNNKTRWNEPLFNMGGKTCRQLATSLGTEWGRNCVDADLWVNIGIERYRDLLRHSRHVTTVIVDNVRFPNEAAVITRNGGKLIAVHRPGLTPDTAHESEQYIEALQKNCSDHIYNVDLGLAVAKMRKLIKSSAKR